MPVVGVSNDAIVVGGGTGGAGGEADGLLDGGDGASNEKAEGDNELNRSHIFVFNKLLIILN